jgi:hypothetical protein
MFQYQELIRLDRLPTGFIASPANGARMFNRLVLDRDFAIGFSQ